MKKISALCMILVASIFVFAGSKSIFTVNQFEQTANNTQSVQKLCKPYSNRNQLVDKIQLDKAKQLINKVNDTIGIDGLTLLKMIANKQNDQAEKMVRDNFSGTIFFIAQFGIGFILLIITWPFLLICCLCKCCEKPLNKKINLCLTILLTLSLTLAIVTSIYGLTQTLSVGSSIQKAGCSSAIVADDLLYGNRTINGLQFFNGFYKINSSIGLLQANLDNIANNFSTLMPNSSDPTLEQSFRLLNQAKKNTILISNNDNQGRDLIISYKIPLNSSTPSGKIQSFFPQILGSYSSKSGIVWQIYQALQSFNQTLLDVRSSAVNYYNQIGNIDKEIEPIQSASRSIIYSINETETQTSKYLPQILNWISYSDFSVRAYHGLVISFSAIGILVAVLAKKADMCRYFLNFICVMLFFVAFIGFTVSLSFTAALPPLGWSCGYIENSLSNQSNFMGSYIFIEDNFSFLVDKDTLNDISVCMPYGNGDILSRIGINAMAGINNLTEVIKQLNTFNISQYREEIVSNMTTGYQYVQNFTYSQIIDIYDRSSLQILNRLSYSNSGIYSGCVQQIKSDSWIPSGNPNQQYPHINCTTSGAVGNQNTCPNGVQTVGQCSGCMDSSSIFNTYWKYSDRNILTDLSQRYGGSCSLNTELNNVWSNYYKVKADIYGPNVQGSLSNSGVLPRTTNVLNDVDELIKAVDPALPNLFRNILFDLNSVQDLLDPQYGFIAGLNCRLMGQDFQRVQESICGSLYIDFYMTRFSIGLASYGILISLCFMVWVSKKDRKVVHSEELYQSQSPYYRMESINLDQ